MSRTSRLLPVLLLSLPSQASLTHPVPENTWSQISPPFTDLSCTPPHELFPVPSSARNSARHVAGPPSGSGQGDQLFQPTLLFLFNSLYLRCLPYTYIHTHSAVELLVVPGECVLRVRTRSPTCQASSSRGRPVAHPSCAPITSFLVFPCPHFLLRPLETALLSLSKTL